MNYKEFLASKENKEVINESFKLSKQNIVVDAIHLYLNKNAKFTVVSSPFYETFYAEGGEKKQGVRFYTHNAKTFRLNWKESVKDSFDFESIDFWFDGRTEEPQFEYDIKGMNINFVISLILSLLDRKTTDTTVDKKKLVFNYILSSSKTNVNESLSPQENDELVKLIEEANDVLIDSNLDPNSIPDNLYDRIYDLLLKKKGVSKIEEIIEEKPIQIEEVPQKVKELEKKMANNISKKSAIGVVMDDHLPKILKAVVDQVWYSVILTGTPGIGKTVSISKHLNNKYGMKEGVDFIIIGGNVASFGLYELVYRNREDKILIFDDCDSIFDSKSNSFLNNILNKQRVRTVSWISSNPTLFDPTGKTEEEIEKEVSEGKLPNTFKFESSVIIITNKKPNDISDSLKSRSQVMEMWFSTEDIIERIEELMPDMDYPVSMQEKRELLEILKNIKDYGSKKSVDLRTYTSLIQLYIVNKGDSNWKDLIQYI